MKRLVTAIVLLAATLALCVGIQRSLDRLSDGMAAQVDRFSLCASLNDPENAKTAIVQAHGEWLGHRALLGSVLPHNELDEIDRLFAVSLQAVEDGDLHECRLRAAELSARIRHLPERERPKIENIL